MLFNRRGNFAQIFLQRLEEVLQDEQAETPFVTFVLKGTLYATPTNRDIQDVLRSKRLIDGVDYRWEGPYTLHINPQYVDQDVRHMLSLQGAIQIPRM